MQGTTNLLDILVNEKTQIKKLVVAASMSSYGEGLYQCERCQENFKPKVRNEEQLKTKIWDHRCPNCSDILKPIPMPEDVSLDSTSVYAITKKGQEELVLNVCSTYGIPAVALRYFNVYGPRQSLSNPHTGVVAIFMSRLKNKNKPVIYEGGLQTRDFVSVYDIVDANIAALKSSNADYQSFNVGTGNPVSVLEVAKMLANIYGVGIEPLVTNRYRAGDIRHCFANISKIKRRIGWEPKIKLEESLTELVKWTDSVKAVDKFEIAQRSSKTEVWLS